MKTVILFGFVFGAAIVSAVLTYLEIPVLLQLKTGQNIREEGPKAHLGKAGTPSMGGIAMIVTFSLFSIFLLILKRDVTNTVLPVLISMLAYAAIGFYDDFLKIKKHQNEGLTSKQKFLLQIVIGTFFAVYRYVVGSTKLFIPFMSKPVDFGFWIIPFTIFVFVAMTNAVNLTDGLDGLASSVTACASLFIAILCLNGIKSITGGVTTGYAGNEVSGVLALVLMGCCIGFFLFNHYPAHLFMGDTGSLALGACITGIAMTSGFDFALPIVGIIYVVEALSVIIQVVVFKTQNGRRFFRMAPIHHHFELGGWSEDKVDRVFCLITIVMGVIALLIFR